MNYKNRILKLREILKVEKVDAVLVSSISNILYFTGFSNFSKDEREAYLLITKKSAYVITDARYSEAVKESVPHCMLLERNPQNSTLNLLKKVVNTESVKSLGFEDNNLTVAEYQELAKTLNASSPKEKSFQKSKSGIQLQHTSMLKPIDISKIREIKEDEEIIYIQKACAIGDMAFDFLLGKIKSGISEKELAFELEFFVKRRGATLSFDPIVAFGPNSSAPHHETGNKKLTKADHFVLLDFGVKWDNYCSDMTRTVFFGKPNREEKKMYETVKAAQEKAIELLSHPERQRRTPSGSKVDPRQPQTITAYDIDSAARSYIVSQGYPTIPHSVGHGIGLEVHELPWISPRINEKLKPGMVFSIEPGIYIPKFGGVRIEDLVAITKNQARVLTTAPKEIVTL